jgi:hypothetical protein
VLKLKERLRERLSLAFLPRPSSLRLSNVALLLTPNFLRPSCLTIAFKLNSVLSVASKDTPNLHVGGKKSVSNTQGLT